MLTVLERGVSLGASPSGFSRLSIAYLEDEARGVDDGEVGAVCIPVKQGERSWGGGGEMGRRKECGSFY